MFCTGKQTKDERLLHTTTAAVVQKTAFATSTPVPVRPQLLMMIIDTSKSGNIWKHKMRPCHEDVTTKPQFSNFCKHGVLSVESISSEISRLTPHPHMVQLFMPRYYVVRWMNTARSQGSFMCGLAFRQKRLRCATIVPKKVVLLLLK